MLSIKPLGMKRMLMVFAAFLVVCIVLASSRSRSQTTPWLRQTSTQWETSSSNQSEILSNISNVIPQDVLIADKVEDETIVRPFQNDIVQSLEASPAIHGTTSGKGLDVARTLLSQRQCDPIPSWLLHQLVNRSNATSTSNPIIVHFNSGTLVTEEKSQFEVGTEFCSVIFAPQGPGNDSRQFQNQPVEGWGPDSLHLEIVSPDIRLIPEHPEYWGSLESTSPRIVFAIYTIAYALNHPGTYEVNGEVEFQDYDWVMEDPIDFHKGEEHPYTMIANSLQARSPPLVINGTPLSRPTQQCYRSGANDLRGRWYRATSFSSSGNQTSLNPTAVLPFANHNTTTDEWGWTFAPDACSLQVFTPAAISSCLADRTLQILGESNSRRLLKALVSGGHWCTDKTDKICQCEDQWEEEIYDFNFSPLNSTRFRDTSIRDTPTYFGSNSSVYFDFVGGMLNGKLWNPWFFFFDPTSPDDRGSIISRRVEEHGPIDLVHVSLLTWDVAGVRSPVEILEGLPNFRAKLLSAYPPGTRFITRLANNMCCGNQNYKTRFSAPRFARFNAMWRRFWLEDEKAGAMRVDDASVLQGRRDAETAFHCPTTHLRGSHVRIEAMMWLNSVCENDAGSEHSVVGASGVVDGKARMQNWGYTAANIELARAQVVTIGNTN